MNRKRNLPKQNIAVFIKIRSAPILRLLGNETNQFIARGKKTELSVRKQLNIEVKSTTKLDFPLNILIYLYILQMKGVSVSVFTPEPLRAVRVLF